MARSQNQKTKILHLERMLKKTDENHAVSLSTILTELGKYEICAERKSIYDDFEALRSFGMDIHYKRGKKGGYYLAGNVVEAENKEEFSELSVSADVEIPENELLEIEKTEGFSETEENVLAEIAAAEQAEANGKTMKLQFTKEKESAIKQYFGKLENVKEKENGLLSCCVAYACDPQFFGWLTAMGKDVKIAKPKKLGQSYREYLKTIAKAYK